MRPLAAGVAALAALAFLLPGRATAATPVQWCGTNTAATDRAPDSTAGRQIHLVYAFPSDGADRTLEVASVIASDLADVDTWWRREDPTRTPRFDTFAFPGCTSRLGALDISSARLPQPASFYATEDSRYARVRDALAAAPFSFANTFKKYLVYYDGAQDDASCGQAITSLTAGGTNGYALVYVRGPRGCHDRGDSELRLATTTAQEIVHVLGAFSQRGAPNECQNDNGFACDSAADVISPNAGSYIFDLKLDVGRDDYYAHPGSWADVQDSQWLSRLDTAPAPLTVTVAGAGSVAADLPGIAACTSTCRTDLDQGTVVTLVATPAAGSVFHGWSGACAGATACTLTIDAAKTVTATFATPVRLTAAASGPGSVASTPAGISCPGTCASDFDRGTQVTLTATPRPGARFSGWTGACSGAAPTCAVKLDAATSVQAAFELVRTLAVRVTGSGTVTSAPAGVRCKPACSATYDDGAAVRLVARPARGWKLSRWSGACTGSRACTVTLRADARVNALFVRIKKR